jgi:hypothetical protein
MTPCFTSLVAAIRQARGYGLLVNPIDDVHVIALFQQGVDHVQNG